MGRTPCFNADGLKKGAWTADEDQKLIAYINEHGEGGWRTLPQKAGLQRCGKSCRLRWINYLRPDIKRGEFSPEEEQTIIHLHASKGNKWSVIARHIPGRTDNEIKNYWNTNIKRRLVKMGIDPVTHKPLGAVDSPRQKDSNTVANPDHTSEVPQLESQASPSQSRSVSASAQLLNKVATNLARTASHGTLSVVVESSSGSESNKGQSTESPKFSSSSSENSTSSISNSSSTSKILNRMASKLTLIKEILSTSIETVATDDCSDARGGVGDEDDSTLYVFHGDIGNSFIAECPLSASTPSLSESTMEISMSDSVSAGLMAATLSPSCCDHLDMTNESGIIGQDSTFDMDMISCSYNMDSPIPSINFLQDITAQDPPFKLGNLLDTSGGEVKNDFASRNMILESQDASSDVEEPGFPEVLIDFLLNDPDDSENTLSTSTRDSHVNYVFESIEGKSLHESMNNWNDNLDFGNYGLPD